MCWLTFSHWKLLVRPVMYYGGMVECCTALAFTDLIPFVSWFQLIFNKIDQPSSRLRGHSRKASLQAGTEGGLTTPREKW